MATMRASVIAGLLVLCAASLQSPETCESQEDQPKPAGHPTEMLSEKNSPMLIATRVQMGKRAPEEIKETGEGFSMPLQSQGIKRPGVVNISSADAAMIAMGSSQTCTSTAGASCACNFNPDYLCYAAYAGACYCWSGTQAQCSGMNGFYCGSAVPITSCGSNCARCLDSVTCGNCNAGYMLVQGQCAVKPTTASAVWVKAHNIYRCMHGANPVTWSTAAASNAQTYVNTLTSLVHSKSYSLTPPNGPAGENLAMGYTTAEAATGAWYSEVSGCIWPGCSTGTNGAVTGHFTAMIWKATTQIGCGINTARNIEICRYLVAAPNIMGQYSSNVAAKVKDVKTCIAQFGG